MKLKSVDQPKIFYQVAHRLIVLQKDTFTLSDILKQYYAKCGSNINLDRAKKIVIEQLDELITKGIVKESHSGSYYTIFCKNDCNKDQLKEELSKDESWISLY